MIQILEDDVINIHRGDSAYINVTLKEADGSEYELQPDDYLTLTVRAEPTHESPVLLVSKSNTTALFLSADAMDAIPAGKYSYDIELTFANGERTTIVPKLRENGKGTNYKNFIVDAEVSN